MRWNRSKSSIAVLLFVFSANFVVAQVAPFTEEAVARGLTHFTYSSPSFGYGLGLDDLDGDGDPDLIATGKNLGQIAVYENIGSAQFVERTATSNLPYHVRYNAVSLVDYDGDGDLDVFVAGYQIPDLMLRNEGNFIFTDVTEEVGFGDEGKAIGATWIDQDGDGWLDMYLSNYNFTGSSGGAFPNRFYKNMGGNTFSEIADELGIADLHLSFQAVFFDPDRDGDHDLYVSNDKGFTDPATHYNRFWLAESGLFEDVGEISGAQISIDSMGIDIGDLDQDGQFDIYCTNSPQVGNQGENVLLCGNGDLTFIDRSTEAQVEASGVCWGACFLDFDNDGFEELYVTASNAQNRLYNCDGLFPCEDIAPILDLAFSSTSTSQFSASFCIAKADLDLDGDLDLITQSKNENLALYINHEGDYRNSLRLKLKGNYPNTNAIGSLVRITTQSGSQWREVRSGDLYKSSSETAITVGLSDHEEAQEILIRWPNGKLSFLEDVAAGSFTLADQNTLESFSDCNRNLIPDLEDIVQDPGLDSDNNGIIDVCTLFLRGDGNNDQLLDVADAITSLDALFGQVTVPCEMALDCNDDSLLNIADPIYLLGHLFSGGPHPPAPNSTCGTDPTSPGALPCTSLPACP